MVEGMKIDQAEFIDMGWRDVHPLKARLTTKMKVSGWGVVVHTFDPSTWEAEAGGSL